MNQRNIARKMDRMVADQLRGYFVAWEQGFLRVIAKAQQVVEASKDNRNKLLKEASDASEAVKAAEAAATTAEKAQVDADSKLPVEQLEALLVAKDAAFAKVPEAHKALAAAQLAFEATKEPAIQAENDLFKAIEACPVYLRKRKAYKVNPTYVERQVIKAKKAEVLKELAAKAA